MSRALTIGEVAKRLGYPLHRIEYIIRSRNIRPRLRAGNARVFSGSDLQYIASVLRHIDAERERVSL